MLIRNTLFSLIGLIIISCSGSVEVSQWRGPNRDGKYPDKGLLKEWPEAGPDLLWTFEGLGAGHGNVGFSKDKIFILGMPDSTGVLYAFDYKGKLLWKKEYGIEWHLNYKGSRSTPSIVGDLVYFTSGKGYIYCYDGNSGEKKWSVDLHEKYGAQKIGWGITESLLIDGDHVFCTPGGTENNIVALNRFTGKTIWTSPGNRQPSAYCSPILVKHNQTSLIVTMTAASVIGVDAGTGQAYWQIPQMQRFKIHSNTPVYSDGRVFCASENADSTSGFLAVKLSEDGRNAKVLWRIEEFKNLMGGMIYIDGYLFASEYRRNKWSCINANSGKIVYSSNVFGDGALIWADSLFYCYSEKGEMALVKADTTSFNIISKFKVPLGTDQHWAHPVIHQGRLYIRHGDALMVYDIRD